MRFTIEFYEPFRVSTGVAAAGVDSATDPDELIPGSSLKGVMRRAASDLGIQPPVIARVFGASGEASPWAWSAATVSEHEIRDRVRIAINPDRHAVEDGAMQVAHDVWATRASFTIDRTIWLPDDEVERHEMVLAASACAVHSLGADRNRGMGWVGITCDGRDIEADLPNLVPVLKGRET